MIKQGNDGTNKKNKGQELISTFHIGNYLGVNWVHNE